MKWLKRMFKTERMKDEIDNLRGQVSVLNAEIICLHNILNHMYDYDTLMSIMNGEYTEEQHLDFEICRDSFRDD